MEGVPGYLRYRVVNPRANNFTDGFENGGAKATAMWHSLGTEAGTDNSINYWVQTAGAWSFASNLLTSPAAANDLIYGGHADWTDISFAVRFKWSTGTAPQIIIHNDTTVNNFICGVLSSGAFSIQKKVAGTLTTASSVTAAPSNGTFFWISVVASGTSYTAGLFNDSSGAIGVQVATLGPVTISDAGIQSGYCGIGTSPGTTAVTTHGGAFPFVCYVNGTPPDGWAPTVTTGEPAFAWSAVTPFAGSKSASIQILGSASGNGAWQRNPYPPTLNLPTSVSVEAKASSGTANLTVGGLTTGNAGTAYTALTVNGTPSANATVSLNYSGATGKAYFDSLSLNPNGEITNDLPHLHQSQWTVVAMQPGNPGSSALGSFTIPLYPPGSEGYANAKPIYDQLARYMRVEAYISHDGASLGNLAFAGAITGIRKLYGSTPTYELTGISDVGLANYSRPFPGELLSNDVTSAILKSYLGTNELGLGDAFNPFVAANYTSGSLPSKTSGTWTGVTDDGLNVVSIGAGTGAILLSKFGGTANDRWKTFYVEMTGRLEPSTDSTNAGAVGVGLSFSNLNAQDSIYGFAQAAKLGGRWQLSCGISAYAAGVSSVSSTVPNALINVDDPGGFVPITIGLLFTMGGSSVAAAAASLIVNGRIVISYWGGVPEAPANSSMYPFLLFVQPGTGSAQAFLTNLTQYVRFTTDGPSSSAVFGNGTITTTTHSLMWGNDPGPSFLEAWTRLATREGFYWRYTPQAYVLGTRTLGTVDFAADPGTDRTKSVIFDRALGNLLSLEFGNNADVLAADTALSGQSTLDGAGIGYWRDIATVQKYGVIQDEALGYTNSDFNSLRRAAKQLNANKIALDTLGAKTAVVLRDPQVADTYRELDKVTVNDPEMGLINASVRIMARTFTEGSVTETLLLDQFPEES